MQQAGNCSLVSSEKSVALRFSLILLHKTDPRNVCLKSECSLSIPIDIACLSGRDQSTTGWPAAVALKGTLATLPWLAPDAYGFLSQYLNSGVTSARAKPFFALRGYHISLNLVVLQLDF